MMNKPLNKLLYIALVFLQIWAYAQFSKNQPELITSKKLDNQRWTMSCIYIEKDSPSFALPDYDDRDWKEFKNVEKFNNSDKERVVWVRTYFKVEDSLVNLPLHLNVVHIGAYEIFLDGKKLESVGTINNNKAEKYSMNNRFPTLFSLSEGTHVIAIRFFPFPARKFDNIVNVHFNRIDLKLHPAKKYIDKQMKQTQDMHQYTMLICGFFLALAIIHFILFIFYRKALYNLYFACYNLSLSYIAYFCLAFYRLDNPVLLTESLFKFLVAIAVFSISLSGFVNTLFSKKKLRFTFFLAIEIIALLLFYFSKITTVTIVLTVLMFVVIESFILIVKGMIKREISAFIVGGGIITFLVYILLIVLSTIFDFWSYTLDVSLLSVIVLFSFPLSISAYLGWQYASTNVSLQNQLDEVNRLSEINLQQEEEKQQILQNQNEVLEKQVTERTHELQIEKQKSEDLLLNILPQEVADELKEKGSTEAKYYDEVSVLFTDFVNFTQSSERMGAEKMLKELNECFTAFDLIMEKHGLEKIKTIGDAYLAVCGLPHKDADHAYHTVLAGLDIIQFLENRKKQNPDTLDIRIGINSGSLVAGIVGVKKFAYDIWGDTVNTAARMEQNSEKGKINISDTTYQLVKNKINCEYRGKKDTKGKGEMDMYFVIGKKNLTDKSI